MSEPKDFGAMLDALYNDRANYTIVALTGYTGTGCTRLADIMSRPFAEWPDLRVPAQLSVGSPADTDNEAIMTGGHNNHRIIAASIFARKYAICHDFASAYIKPFRVIKYSNVLLYYSVLKLRDKSVSIEDFKKKLLGLFQDKYRPSRTYDGDYTGSGAACPWEHFDEKVRDLDVNWNVLHAELSWDNFEPFFKEDSEFNKFIGELTDLMWRMDAYCTMFFFHRLGYVLRATGDPEVSSRDVSSRKINDGKHLYCIANLINGLIKCYRKKFAGDGGCRIVIDKIRNSLEAKYLKERYSAFYFVAVHEEDAVQTHLRRRLERRYATHEEINADRGVIDQQVTKILKLDRQEREDKDFECGWFFAPNLGQCMADAEIHISNREGAGGDIAQFYSMTEQWMKFATLILHPGLITPSSEERCMVVAYTAKFNSGCLSRQVGAVITNKAHTIRSIGWNDVPYGQLPCALRQLPVMATGNGDVPQIRSYVYSSFELSNCKPYNDGQTFGSKVLQKYRNLHLGTSPDLMNGLPHSYCFKSLHNEFEHEKNQVHTRSLHAEENAILQMAKYGGEALHEGIIYVTASPCELCCKKLYQIGVRKIVYIDEYPGISRENIIANGYNRPHLKQFQGAYGQSYFKLYQPIISYKDELALRCPVAADSAIRDYNAELLSGLLKELGIENGGKVESEEQLNDILATARNRIVKEN